MLCRLHFDFGVIHTLHLQRHLVNRLSPVKFRKKRAEKVAETVPYHLVCKKISKLKKYNYICVRAFLSPQNHLTSMSIITHWCNNKIIIFKIFMFSEAFGHCFLIVIKHHHGNLNSPGSYQHLTAAVVCISDCLSWQSKDLLITFIF